MPYKIEGYDITFVEYDEEVCPFCGGKMGHQVTGHINKDEETYKRWEESLTDCTIVEVCDEGDGTIGYTVCCRNENYD